MLPDDVTQRGQGDLIHRRAVIVHRDHGALRLDHTEPQHRVDADRHAVLGDRFLRLHADRRRADVNNPRSLDVQRDDPEQPRPANTLIAPQAEHDRPLVLGGDAQPRNEQYKHDQENNQHGLHGRLLYPFPVS